MGTDRHERAAARRPMGFGLVADTRVPRRARASPVPRPMGLSPVADTHHAVGARHSQCIGFSSTGDPPPGLQQRCARWDSNPHV